MSYQAGIDDDVGAEISVLTHEWVPPQYKALVKKVVAAYNAMPIHKDFDFNDNYEQTSIKGAVKRLGEGIGRWGSVLTEWAKRGFTDDSRPYSWLDWASHADVLISEIESQGGYFEGTGELNSVRQAARATYSTIAKNVGDVTDNGLTPFAIAAGAVLGIGLLIKISK